MKMYVAGEWIDKPQRIEVGNPYDNSVIDTVPRGDRGDVERALQSAERGARAMAKLSGYDRWKILRKAADLMAARQQVQHVGGVVGDPRRRGWQRAQEREPHRRAISAYSCGP